MFHTLCEANADALIGTASPQRTERAWRQTYRAANHRQARFACVKALQDERGFPEAARQFASHFEQMQQARHSADYDPAARFTKEDVRIGIATAAQVCDAFAALSQRQKAAFAALVLFPQRD